MRLLNISEYLRGYIDRQGTFVTVLRCPACYLQFMLDAGQSHDCIFFLKETLTCPHCGQESEYAESESRGCVGAFDGRRRSKVHGSRSRTNHPTLGGLFD